MTVPEDTGWFTDDDRLLAELGTAVRRGDEVPESFLRVGQGAIAWRTVDAELAALEFDSAAAAGSGLRAGEPGGPRELSFTGPNLGIELEIHPDSIRGQLIPAQSGMIVLRLDDESSRTVAADDVGWFVSPAPAGRFRLQVRTADAMLITDWIE
jgi:hypothetical protein